MPPPVRPSPAIHVSTAGILTEGIVKKGGVAPKPVTPKPPASPVSQKKSG